MISGERMEIGMNSGTDTGMRPNKKAEYDAMRTKSARKRADEMLDWFMENPLATPEEAADRFQVSSATVSAVLSAGGATYGYLMHDPRRQQIQTQRNRIRQALGKGGAPVGHKQNGPYRQGLMRAKAHAVVAPDSGQLVAVTAVPGPNATPQEKERYKLEQQIMGELDPLFPEEEAAPVAQPAPEPEHKLEPQPEVLEAMLEVNAQAQPSSQEATPTEAPYTVDSWQWHEYPRPAQVEHLKAALEAEPGPAQPAAPAASAPGPDPRMVEVARQMVELVGASALGLEPAGAARTVLAVLSANIDELRTVANFFSESMQRVEAALGALRDKYDIGDTSEED